MKKFLDEWLSYIIIIVVIIIVRCFIVTPVRVSGNSMKKTLNNGDIMILYRLAKIEKEDIVVIDKKVSGSRLIKRIIGMPGDTLYCKDGIIYINGKKYDDKYAYGDTSDFDTIKLKDDEYFVLGDNRLVSNDSRYLGPINKKYIQGESSFVIFPFSKFGNAK